MVKTKIVTFTGVKKVEVREIKIPTIGNEEVLISTLYSGISSGTERWILNGDFLGSNMNYPYAPGYQAVGRIEKIGKKVQGLKEGDYVFVSGNKIPVYNGFSGSGCHSKYIVSDYKKILKLPKGIDLVSASIGAIPAVSLYAVEFSKIKANEFVIVFGLGLIGQTTCQIARMKGAKVIGIDAKEIRLKIAKRYSADWVINRKRENVKAKVFKICKNGADIVIDTTSYQETIDKASELLRIHGRLVLEGYYPGIYNISLDKWHWNDVIVYNAGQGMGDQSKVLTFIRDGKINLRPLVTHILKPKESPKAYHLITNEPEKTLGIVFDWKNE